MHTIMHEHVHGWTSMHTCIQSAIQSIYVSIVTSQVHAWLPQQCAWMDMCVCMHFVDAWMQTVGYWELRHRMIMAMQTMTMHALKWSSTSPKHHTYKLMRTWISCTLWFTYTQTCKQELEVKMWVSADRGLSFKPAHFPYQLSERSYRVVDSKENSVFVQVSQPSW
jgi:hypothetical protein